MEKTRGTDSMSGRDFMAGEDGGSGTSSLTQPKIASKENLSAMAISSVFS